MQLYTNATFLFSQSIVFARRRSLLPFEDNNCNRSTHLYLFFLDLCVGAVHNIKHLNRFLLTIICTASPSLCPPRHPPLWQHQPIDFASHRPSQCNNNWMPSSSFVDINQSATLPSSDFASHRRRHATTTGIPSFPLLTIKPRDTFQPLDFASHRPSQCNNNWMPSSSVADTNQTATLLALSLPITHTIACRSAQPWDLLSHGWNHYFPSIHHWYSLWSWKFTVDVYIFYNIQRIHSPWTTDYWLYWIFIHSSWMTVLDVVFLYNLTVPSTAAVLPYTTVFKD